MVQKAYLVLILSFCSFCGFSQGFKNFDYYYAHPQVSMVAKEYYAQLFDVNSSNKAYSIIDSTFTKNDETRPFYIFLVGRMLNEAKGELLVDLNIICRHIAESYPSSLIPVLFAGENYIDDDVKLQWAARTATEIRVTCSNDLMVCFKESRRSALQRCETQYKNRLEVLYNMVRKDLNLFQQQ